MCPIRRYHDSSLIISYKGCVSYYNITSFLICSTHMSLIFLHTENIYFSCACGMMPCVDNIQATRSYVHIL